MSRTVGWLVDWRWPVARVVIWIGGSALLAVLGRWLAAGIAFVVLGAYPCFLGCMLLLARRGRAREEG